MPFYPIPRIYRCPKCGWKKITTPKGDVIMPGDIFEQCPQCGYPKLEVKLINTVWDRLKSLWP